MKNIFMLFNFLYNIQYTIYNMGNFNSFEKNDLSEINIKLENQKLKSETITNTSTVTAQSLEPKIKESTPICLDAMLKSIII